MTVFMKLAFLLGETRHLPAMQSLELIVVRLHVVGMRDFAEIEREQRRLRIPQHRTEGVIDAYPSSLDVAQCDTDICVVDGICTHGQVHLAAGAIVDGADGSQIECPKHNGRFDLATGAPCRKPVKEPIAVHQADTSSDHIIIFPAKSDS